MKQNEGTRKEKKRGDGSLREKNPEIILIKTIQDERNKVRSSIVENAGRQDYFAQRQIIRLDYITT